MPNSAKLADFFQGHFIRFWNRGQAGNEVSERIGVAGVLKGATGWASLPDRTYGTYRTNMRSRPIGPIGPISPILERSPTRRARYSAATLTPPTR
jgi:hypothetical protein